VKRYWSTSEYARRQRIRSLRGLKRDAQRRDARRERRRQKLRLRESRLTAPAALSLFEASDATVRFCNALRVALRRRGSEVYVDLRQVTRVTSDALLLMRATIDAERGYKHVRGNLPDDPEIAAKVRQSGFLTGFTKTGGKLPAPKGVMQTRKKRLVASEYAGELVDFAQRNAAVTDSVAEASYKCLIELMLNTHNHAAGHRRTTDKVARRKMKRQLWMASVYCELGVAHFTFIDLGIGLLKSVAPVSFVKSIGQNMLSLGQPQLLREIFSGRVAATVLEPGHGLGLPDMYKAARKGNLPDLRVLTSAVTGEVATMDFHSNATGLRGTVFRWRTGSIPVT